MTQVTKVPEKEKNRPFSLGLINIQQVVILLVLIALMIVIASLTDKFATQANIVNVLRQTTPVIIAACAATLIMISGGLDISVGGVLAFSGVVGAKLATLGIPLGWAIIGGVLAGGLMGIVNGFLIVNLRITPVIATLGTMSISRGLAFLISDGRSVVTGLPSEFRFIGRDYIWEIPVPVLIMFIVFLIFFFLLRSTLIGKYTYAIGGNKETARLSGVPVRQVQFLLYALGGLTAGLAGVILASRLASGQPDVGVGFEFDVIIAVILGGTSLAGGEGSVFGTLVGALIVGVLNNGLNLLGVHTFYQFLLSGGVLIFAVLLDMTLKGEGLKIPERWRTRL